MRRRLVMFISVAMFVVGAFATTASAGSNGQGIGQDPIRLALTRCASAHGNNVEAWDPISFSFTGRVLRDDCLGHAPGTLFSGAEIAAIRDMAGPQFCSFSFGSSCPGGVPPTQGCWFIGGLSGQGIVTWDIDPGSSGAHNTAGRLPVL